MTFCLVDLSARVRTGGSSRNAHDPLLSDPPPSASMRGCRCALLWPESYETLLSISGLPWRWDFLFRDRRAGTRCPVPPYSAADEFYRRRPFMAIPSILSSGDVNASDQSFQVPLPWPHNSFVEVIQVGNDLTFCGVPYIPKLFRCALPSITTGIPLIGVV